jgi:hypothetical protein
MLNSDPVDEMCYVVVMDRYGAVMDCYFVEIHVTYL